MSAETRLFDVVGGRQSAKEPAPLMFADVMPTDLGNATSHVLELEQEIAFLTSENKRQRLLLTEANHRAKNMLALVQAMVSQSLRAATSPQAASGAIVARIAALGQAQNMLTDELYPGATIREAACVALAPHGKVGEDGRIHVDGPSIPLDERQTLALSLALHELGTNAVKYGALSNSSGHIDIKWHVLGRASHRKIRLVWSEHGGPIVEKPTRSGFGSALIHRALADSLGGEVLLSYDQNGLVCTIEWPVQVHSLGQKK